MNIFWIIYPGLVLLEGMGFFFCQCVSPRFIKRRVNLGMGFGSFNTARRTLSGYEAMNMIRKGQIQGVEKGDILGQVEFVYQIFGVAA